MDKKNTTCWSSCPDCQGQGKKSQRLRKKVRLQYQQLVAKLSADGEVVVPEAPKAPLVSCSLCGGSGLIPSEAFPVVATENYPHISIIGGGIGGVALAVACLHRGIPYTLFERDTHFEARSQGYGLTLQQASKAIEGFGIFSLTEGVVSTRHLVHKTDGTVIGEWGMRKWVQPSEKNIPNAPTFILRDRLCVWHLWSNSAAMITYNGDINCSIFKRMLRVNPVAFSSRCANQNDSNRFGCGC